MWCRKSLKPTASVQRSVVMVLLGCWRDTCTPGTWSSHGVLHAGEAFPCKPFSHMVRHLAFCHTSMTFFSFPLSLSGGYPLVGCTCHSLCLPLLLPLAGLLLGPFGPCCERLHGCVGLWGIFYYSCFKLSD